MPRCELLSAVLALFVCASFECGAQTVPAPLPPSGFENALTYGLTIASDGDLLASGGFILPDGEAPRYFVVVFAHKNGEWVRLDGVLSPDPAPYITSPVLSLSGDSLVVAWPTSGSPGADLHHYQIENGEITPRRPLPVPDSASVRFGANLLQMEHELLVSDSLARIDGVETGLVHVYSRATGDFELVGQIMPPNPAQTFEFGTGMALDGESLAVASESIAVSPSGGLAFGAIDLYSRDGEGWSWDQQIVPESSTFAVFRFGRSVSWEGDTLIAGCPNDDDPQFTTGSVFVFERDAGGTWRETARLRPMFPAPTLAYGVTTALAGDNLLVGHAPTNSNTLQRGVHLYRRINGVWSLISRVLPPTPAQSRFGQSIVNHRDGVVIGSPLWSITNPPTPGLWWVVPPSSTPAPQSPVLEFPDDGALAGTTIVQLRWTRSLASSGYRLTITRRSTGAVVLETILPQNAENITLSIPDLPIGARLDWGIVALGDGVDLPSTPATRSFRTRLTPDVTNDCVVSFADLNGVLGFFGLTGSNVYGDVNRDGVVNFTDLNLVLSNFGRVCDP